MNQIIPDRKYKGLPCSIVAIGCATGGKIVNVNTNNEGYATLKNADRVIRQNCMVKKYTYLPKEKRIPLWRAFQGKQAGRFIICVLGHFLYADFSLQEYWSFFDNSNDMIVAVWELM